MQLEEPERLMGVPRGDEEADAGEGSRKLEVFLEQWNS